MSKKLTIDLLSDTHNRHIEFKCSGGDMLLHSGDVSSRGGDLEILNFINWFEMQPYEHKIFIPGNHDWSLERNFGYWKDECAKRKIHLLNDSGVIIKDIYDPSINIKIWGSPVQPWFHDWAFNRRRGEDIKKHWDLIPVDTEILLTHGPAYGILDEVTKVSGDPYNPPQYVGCEDLLKAIEASQIKLHVSGHIHEGRGFHYARETTYVNASSLDRMYCPVGDKPMRVTREVCMDGSIAYIL